MVARVLNRMSCCRSFKQNWVAGVCNRMELQEFEQDMVARVLNRMSCCRSFKQNWVAGVLNRMGLR